jgi:hypothetical protein
MGMSHNTVYVFKNDHIDLFHLKYTVTSTMTEPMLPKPASGCLMITLILMEVINTYATNSAVCKIVQGKLVSDYKIIVPINNFKEVITLKLKKLSSV